METTKQHTAVWLQAKVCECRLGLWLRLYASSVCDDNVELCTVNEPDLYLYDTANVIKIFQNENTN